MGNGINGLITEMGVSVRSEYDDNFDGKPDEWWTFSDNGT